METKKSFRQSVKEYYHAHEIKIIAIVLSVFAVLLLSVSIAFGLTNSDNDKEKRKPTLIFIYNPATKTSRPVFI